MRAIHTAVVISCAALFTGCASITGDTIQSVRIETRLADGTEVRDAECELFNDHGSFRVKTPGNVMVRRSCADLNVACKKEGQADARASATSRANAGMWGNIIFGGGIGAVIDHNKGTAYTYPQWVQLVFGKLLSFDRSDDKDGQPSLARETASGPNSAPITQSTPAPETKPVSALASDQKTL